VPAIDADGARQSDVLEANAISGRDDEDRDENAQQIQAEVCLRICLLFISILTFSNVIDNLINTK